MINIVKRIDEIEKIIDQYGNSMDPASRRRHLGEIEDMREILSWIEYQCAHPYEAIYVSDSREMSLVMKNTTKHHFRTLNFSLVTYDDKEIKISVNDWRPKKTKKIVFYHDFNSDWHYQTMNVTRFRNDANSVECELYDWSAAPHAAGNKVQEDGGSPRETRGISRKQAYLVAIRSFCETIDEYDLRAKARELEDITIDIFDIMDEKPEMSGQTRKFMVVYLPTVNRMMNDYRKAVSRNVRSEDVRELRANTHEALNLAIVAFRKLKENLTQNNVEEKEVDLDIMRSFMKEEGLIR